MIHGQVGRASRERDIFSSLQDTLAAKEQQIGGDIGCQVSSEVHCARVANWIVVVSTGPVQAVRHGGPWMLGRGD